MNGSTSSMPEEAQAERARERITSKKTIREGFMGAPLGISKVKVELGWIISYSAPFVKKPYLDPPLDRGGGDIDKCINNGNIHT
ncbi:MAG: hypothetical protein UW16_C0038G0005 [Microgenomates group bacterium GW2011_GWC1_44_10]|nr:MAG: hypothetical protein UW16_C0038G0005 [Microgenomates group bacterium GW2011_GWC1_44_10]